MSDHKTYGVTARKDGRWWFVNVPELDVAGQARNAAEIDEVAREIIGLWLDIDPTAFDVELDVKIPGDARAAWERSKALEAAARKESAEAASFARRAVASLRAEGLTYKDAGIVLGLSPQRVQQLSKTDVDALQKSA